jgi:hypothetical protein
MHVPVRCVLMLGAAILLACYQDDVAAPRATGLATVLLTDAGFPFDLVDRVEVYVSEIAASTDADTSEVQEWVPITRPKRAFDLLGVQQGNTVLAGRGALPVGSYRMVRVSLVGDSSHVIMHDGREAAVRWPVEGEFSLHAWVPEPVMVADTGAEIVIDVDVGRSFVSALGDPMYDFVFLAHLRAVNSAATGTLSGSVSGDADGDGTAEPLVYASVSVIKGDTVTLAPWFVVATGHTTTEGAYRIGFLLPGTYLVQVDPPSSVVLASETRPAVRIERGQVTTWSTILMTPGPAESPIASEARRSTVNRR